MSQLNPALALLLSGLSTSEKEESEAWFSGLMGEHDVASLGELQKDAPISFPGWITGWATEEEALNYIKALEAKQPTDSPKKVCIKVTGCPVIKALGNRLVAYRLHGTVSENSSVVDGLTKVNITAKPFDTRTLKESVEAAKAAPVVENKEPETKEGEENKEVKPEEKTE